MRVFSPASISTGKCRRTRGERLSNPSKRPLRFLPGRGSPRAFLLGTHRWKEIERTCTYSARARPVPRPRRRGSGGRGKGSTTLSVASARPRRMVITVMVVLFKGLHGLSRPPVPCSGLMTRNSRGGLLPSTPRPPPCVTSVSLSRLESNRRASPAFYLVKIDFVKGRGGIVIDGSVLMSSLHRASAIPVTGCVL